MREQTPSAELLGERYVPDLARIDAKTSPVPLTENTSRIAQLLSAALPRIREVLHGAPREHGEQLELYATAVLVLLYHRYLPRFFIQIEQELKDGRGVSTVEGYVEFSREAGELLGLGDLSSRPEYKHTHLFALAYQLARAFYNIYYFIVGESAPVVDLRARVWRSIFGFDLERYRRSLFETLGQTTTLVLGPSGTGKELVARAIALARYVPYDSRSKRFENAVGESFFPLNLSAFSPTLIESELFGHKKGAFTGALSDRAGWLEACGRHGSVFWDEIGEIDPQIQVKLLRVLESRSFSRLGDNRQLQFRGKVIAATNRDLAREVERGRFREDFYYRLCSDVVETPTLRARLNAAPDELVQLLRFLAARLISGHESESVAGAAHAWIVQNLNDYAWPGNVRELDQCLRNIIVQGAYTPLTTSVSAVPEDEEARLAAGMREGSITANDLTVRYCRALYERLGSYEATGRKLGWDRRTVKAKVVLPYIE